MNGYDDRYDNVALEAIEDDDAFSEDDGQLDLERGGRRGGRAGGRAGGGRAGGRLPGAQVPRGGYNQPRPSKEEVSQTQVQAVATRIENDVKRLNEADQIINDRVNAANARLDRHAMAIRKENIALKKFAAEQRNTLLLITGAAAFLGPKAIDPPATNAAFPAGTKLLVQEEGDSFKAFVPIAIALFGGQIGGLLGGLESGGSSGNSGL